ncbi:MerR family transcriptional regulator [Streptomyces sp. SID3343]|nr:MerR family transcriptional regulator [Streptomyces sp. SID3343]
MNDDGAAMGIGAFARRVGLSPSALRYYDDCGVLRPASVDAGTGYRFYTPSQEARATLLRGLREAEVPLTEASAVLDGPPKQAEEVLRGHLRRMRDRTDTARAVIEGVLRTLTATGTQAVVGGAEWASAVRQVTPAAGAGEGELAVLGCVLVEVGAPAGSGQPGVLGDGEVRLVATDRYRLSVRTLRPLGIHGEPASVLIPVDDLVETARWAARHAEIVVEPTPDGLRLRAGDDVREHAGFTGIYPAYRDMLAALADPVGRVVVDRVALRDALLRGGSTPACVLVAGDDEVRVDDAPALSAICTGPPVHTAFDPLTLVPALEASVGPDVLLEFGARPFPVVVRSADQGSFTTLVMPVALPADATG